MAERFAQLSYAKRLQVGAIVVKENRVISIGYNGTPQGWDNKCEEDVWIHGVGQVNRTKEEVIHAEANAIAKLARDGESGAGADLFCTHAPCMGCAKLIYGAGIKKFFFRSQYRDSVGLDFLEKCGIQTIQVLDI